MTGRSGWTIITQYYNDVAAILQYYLSNCSIMIYYADIALRNSCKISLCDILTILWKYYIVKYHVAISQEYCGNIAIINIRFVYCCNTAVIFPNVWNIPVILWYSCNIAAIFNGMWGVLVGISLCNIAMILQRHFGTIYHTAI